MPSTSLERVLHQRFPEWGESIKVARAVIGFSFDMSDDDLWQWLTSGGHKRVLGTARSEVRRLGVEEFYVYYLCCFYSNYVLPDGNVDFEAIKGPPWIAFRCPATNYGPEWYDSINKTKSDIYVRLGLEHYINTNNVSGEFLSWFWHEGGCDSVATIALERVVELGLPERESVLWVCCLVRPGAKFMLSKSHILMKRFPQIMEWDQFAATCEDHPARTRVRAYPSYVDWNEGMPPPNGIPGIPMKPGIRCGFEMGQRTFPKITWDPVIATSEADLVETVKSFNRYYKHYYWKGDIQKAQGILPQLSAAKRIGGRPKRGPEWNSTALECARLKDIGKLTYKEIGNIFGFELQRDSYGNLSQCSTARRMVRRGRELISLEQYQPKTR